MSDKVERRRVVELKLKKWAGNQRALHASYAAMKALTGSESDSLLWNPVFNLWDAYTDLVSADVGDSDEWLRWYELECGMGKQPKEVQSLFGRTRTVRTLRDLAAVICD